MGIYEDLANNFSRLPGIGKKSALRMVNWLLKQDAGYVQKFSQNLGSLQQKIKPCKICGAWTEEETCPICSNPLREKNQICVVEESQDVTTIEASKEFSGLFHVLGGVISPLDGIGPEQLSIGKLVERVQKENVQEVIIATNPTIDGDVTALYIQRALSGTNVKISRLASGLPVGGDLEYADKLTLARSFSKRQSL